jgi:hypothetical protein
MTSIVPWTPFAGLWTRHLHKAVTEEMWQVFGLDSKSENRTDTTIADRANIGPVFKILIYKYQFTKPNVEGSHLMKPKVS